MLARHAGDEASAAIASVHCSSSRQWTGRATQCPATQWTVMYSMGPSVLLFTTKRAVTSPGWLQPDVKQGTKSLMGRLLASRIGAFSSVATLSSGIPSRGARRRIVQKGVLELLPEALPPPSWKKYGFCPQCPFDNSRLRRGSAHSLVGHPASEGRCAVAPHSHCTTV